MIEIKQNGRRNRKYGLRIKDDAVLQNTKRATKFGLKVFKGKK